MKAWILIEGWRDGSRHTEGVALTNEGASAWVHRNDEVGHTRSSHPVNVIDEPAMEREVEALRAERDAMSTNFGTLLAHHNALRCERDVLEAERDALKAELDTMKSAINVTVGSIEVLRERDRQDAKWGEQNHDPFTYLTVLMEEVGELAQAALHARFGGHAAGTMRDEAVQTAAVALAIVECLDRDKWSWREDVDTSGNKL